MTYHYSCSVLLVDYVPKPLNIIILHGQNYAEYETVFPCKDLKVYHLMDVTQIFLKMIM